MNGIVLDDQVLNQLRERHPQFHDTAYLFVLSALHYVIERLPEPRHISGRELAEGVRDLAIERFGPMARTVLDHWGIHATADVGHIVFALVEAGILIKQDGDSLLDFADVYTFDEAFGGEYPWRREPR
ncbi:MAG TPA: Minf_1886 family protein [Longimicrobiales bacterium]|nr:Minf_1886 family protein [Longimicrobiales bacterium]